MRPIAAVFVEGVRIVGKAFVEAYKHSIRQRNIKPSPTGKPVQREVMTTIEATKILNISAEERDESKIQSKLLDLIERNVKGESLYIQSRIYWAYHQLQSEYKLKELTGDEVLKMVENQKKIQ